MENLEHEAQEGAARWSARLSADDCTSEERAEYERWRAEVPNREACDRTHHIADLMDSAARHDPRMQRLIERAMSNPATSAQARQATIAHAPLRRFAPLAMAASVVLAVVVVAQRPTETDATRDEEAMVFEAQKQVPRQVSLPDGSIVSIDVGGRISVRMTAGERRIELLAGRALFEVAHDKARPFSVTAGGTRTVALGTRFEVSRRENHTVVTLEEGSVVIDGAEGGARWREQLVPGEQLLVDASNQTRERHSVDVADVSSWARGWLVFRGMPLDTALKEINRYSEKQVVLADASLAKMPVAGRFIAGDSESIVNAIAELLPIRVVGGSHEIILFKRYEN